MMNQKELIQEQLLHAGEQSPVTPEVLALDRHCITPDMVLPPMHFLFRLFNRPCFPRGELVALTGKAKSGKTFVTSMLMTLCARNEVLAFRREEHLEGNEEQPPLRMLWIDTEQSEQSTQDIMCHRIIPMGGAPLFSSDAGSKVFNLRGECWQQRLPLLETAVRHYRPDLVIVDGIRDMVNDINDGVLAQSVLERLMQLASGVECCIVCVLHQNKGSEDHNLRGWIGTELMNKAFEVYACEKLMPQRIFTLEQTHTRKYDIPDVMYYSVGQDGLPGLVGAPVSSEKTKLPSINDEYIVHDEDGSWHIDVSKLFNRVFAEKDRLRHVELQSLIMQTANIRTYQMCSSVISQAVNDRIVSCEKDQNGYKCYRLTPF